MLSLRKPAGIELRSIALNLAHDILTLTAQHAFDVFVAAWAKAVHAW